MKTTLFSFALFFSLVACNNNDVSKVNEPGNVRSFNPLRVEDTSALKLALNEVCGVLEEKERGLDDYVGREMFSFDYQETDCSDRPAVSKRKDVFVTKVAGKYEFQNEESDFGLPEVETYTTGLLKEVCGSLNDLKNPMRASASSQTAIEVRSTETGNCRNDGSHMCLLVMRGRIGTDGESFEVGESALVSFQTARGHRAGFYAYKSVKSYGSCASGKFRTKTARLL